MKAAADRLRSWAIDHALPLWATRGFDREHGRFEERLTLDGRPVVDVPIRLLVQARQIYSYGLAARRGWYPKAAELVEVGFATMRREYHRPDGAEGWVCAIHRDGSIADAKRDLYALAFVLLAVASYVQTTNRREALSIADETLDFIDAAMTGPVGGYLDALPATDNLRRQNPHMHLFEGLLSLWTASGDERYLRRAKELVGLFRDHFFQRPHGILAEYFDERLEPATGVKGRICEPGHHYEWVWLLRWFERASGEVLRPFCDALYSHADRHGYDAAGLVVDELLDDGTVRTASHRAWPMTEAIKANVVEAMSGRRGAADKATVLAGKLMDQFLARGFVGGWMDRVDADGKPATDFMPASTLYHVLCAVDEFDRLSATV
ncbi:MAG: AGE family epimerase/isomerase [Enhydrobacter sp.]|nr:MAG: AGE family epimerase/isomerase [Enhydrobacter sp.]